MARWLNFARKIYRRRIPILIVVGSIFALLITFLCVNGMIIKDISLTKTQIVYGEDYDYGARALFKSVEYEFCAEGSDVWSPNKPTSVGEYRVRAVSRRTFGIKDYSESQVFTILKKEVELKPRESTLVYGNDPTVKPTLVDGDKLERVEYESTSVNVGNQKYKVDAFSVRIANEKGQNVTDCYDLKTPEKTIAVTAKPLTITTDGAEKVYDGEVLENLNYSCGELAYSDKFEYSFLGGITDAGEKQNALSYKILNKSGEDVTNNYNITEQYGLLKVNARPVTLTAGSVSQEYSGLPLKCVLDDAIISPQTEESGLLSGHQFVSINSTSQITDKGEVDSVILSAVIKDGEEDVTLNYDITYVKGTLTITARKISVVKTDLIEYNDNIFTVTDYEYAIDSKQLVSTDHVLSLSTISEFAGEYSGDDVICNVDCLGVSVTDNYDIDCTGVTLTIDKKPLTITANTSSRRYNAQVYSDSGYAVSGLLPNHAESVTVVGEVLNVGDEHEFNNVVSTVSITRNDEKNTNVTENYDVIKRHGTIKIEPTFVKVYNLSATKTYNDKSDISNFNFLLSVQNVEDGGSDLTELFGGQELTFSVCAIDPETNLDAVNAGDYNLNYISGSERVTSGGQEVPLDNYDFNFVDGTLTINKRKFHIITKTKIVEYALQYEYEGGVKSEDLYCHEYTSQDSDEGLVQGHKFDGDWSAITVSELPRDVITDVIKDKRNSVTNYRITKDGSAQDLQSNYDINIIKGVLQINRIQLELIFFPVMSTYSGQAFDLSSNTTITYATGSSHFISGDTPNKSSIKINSLYYESVNKTISRQELDVSTPIIDAGLWEIHASLNINYATGRAITGYYNVSLVGTVTINPAKITIESESDEKVYKEDETLVNDGWRISYSEIGFAGGDESVKTLADGVKIELTVSGEQSTVGKSANTVSAITFIKDGNSYLIPVADKAFDYNEHFMYNYEITIIEGTLKVVNS